MTSKKLKNSDNFYLPIIIDLPVACISEILPIKIVVNLNNMKR